MAGFNWCIGSSDATHVPMLSCASWATNSHKGSKLNVPARTYNITVNHKRQILGSTDGHPGTWNDKKLVLYYTIIKNAHNGEYDDKHEFSLFEYDEYGAVIEIKYKGVWFVVDNGYLAWSCTQPPIKDPVSYEGLRLSSWLESMRKDVECKFGKIKRRFSILKTGIRQCRLDKTDEF